MRALGFIALGTALMAAGCMTAEPSTEQMSAADSAYKMPTTAPAITGDERTITVQSNQTFAQTNSDLQTALAERGLTVFTIVDHSAGAQSVNIPLPPMQLYIFGNPQTGSVLIKANPEIGIELPLKMLVRDSAEGVMISYPSVPQLAEVYGIERQADLVAGIAATLADIAETAAGRPIG